jgi:iron complex outermembrane receptor protein
MVLLAARAQDAQPDLTTMRIEDLMNIDVTSASKKEQKLSQVPAAIFVITKEDIRRSGANNIPDLLRMAPGMDVAQVDANVWAISARGFNGEYASTLLVLVDGRSVYTPTFSGVYWSAQAVPLDSIERIEIIRGPGAAIWGANAVDGVINIITKSARDMQGGAAAVTGGTLDRGSGMASYGGLIGARSAYRVYTDGFEMGPYLTPDHQSAKDDWRRVHGGFRLDTDFSAKDSLTVEGEALTGNSGEMLTSIVSISPPVNAVLAARDFFSGWSVLARWKRAASTRSETSLQAYFDRSSRGDGTYGIGLNTFDLDFQHHAGWGRRQDLVWGLGFRASADQIAQTLRISMNPADLTALLFSAFLQDEIAIRPSRLYLNLGSKFEHEHYNGFNWQPTARITWTPEEKDMFWTAMSAAESTPSQVDASIRFNNNVFPGPGNIPALVSLFGNPKARNERLTAIEAGYRTQRSSELSFDAAAFFNQYRDVISEESGSPVLEANPPPEHLLIPVYIANGTHGETHGIEIFANVKLASRWTLSPGYAFLTMHLRPNAWSTDVATPANYEGGSPNHQVQVRSQVNLSGHWQWTTSAYFVGRLSAPNIPSYTRLDTNLAWQLSDQISVGLVGQNLVKSYHQEFSGPDLSVLPSLVRRSAYARITWWF